MPTLEKKPCNACRLVHECYIAAILLSIIVILVAVKWYRIDKLVELIGFALTVSSLLLAVVAIGYSIYSGTGIERGVNTLVTAVQSIRSSAADIESLKTSLSEELQILAASTGSIEGKLMLQAGALERLTEQRTLATEADPTPSAPTEQGAGQPAKTIRDFIDEGSLAGGLAMLAVARCYELGRSVPLAGPLKDTFCNPLYAHGYLIAATSSGVANFLVDADFVRSVQEPFPIEAATIKEMLIGRVERGGYMESFRNDFQAQIIQADAAFQAPPPALPATPKATLPPD